jgi:hypothetical protein
MALPAAQDCVVVPILPRRFIEPQISDLKFSDFIPSFLRFEILRFLPPFFRFSFQNFFGIPKNARANGADYILTKNRISLKTACAQALDGF